MKNTQKQLKRRLPRILAFMLASVYVLLLLSGCQDNSEDRPADATTVADANHQTNDSETTTEEISVDIPDNLNFGKSKVTFFAWQQSTVEYEAPSDSLDFVDAAVYQRNLNVEERLGVELEFIIAPGNSSSFNEFCKTVENNVNAGASAYDAIACYSRSSGVLAQKGVLLDLNTTAYLDFTKPWWPASLAEENNIGGRLYFMSGDIATSLIYQLTFMIVNNDLLDALGLQNPQSDALAGKWTLDKMIELASYAYSDLDSNGTKSIDDRFGLVINNHPLMDLFFVGSGITYVTANDDGTLTLSDKYFSEKTFTVLDKLRALLWNGNDAIYDKNISVSMMASGNSLLYVVLGQHLATQDFRNASFVYSILPSPKFNEEQESYYTAIGFPHSMYCIPVDALDEDMSSAVLECLGYEGYKHVTPTLFETAFKYRYSNSPADPQILDIIRAGVVFDISRSFFDSLGGDASSPNRVLRSQLENNLNTLISSANTYKKLWENALKSISSQLSK